MTTRNDKERNPLVRLADSLTDDIMKASDEQILAEFSETGGDPVANASEMRAFVDKAIITSNKGRLAAAKAGIAADRKPLRQVTALVDIPLTLKEDHRIVPPGSDRLPVDPGAK